MSDEFSRHVKRGHAVHCRFRLATTCTTPIECEHGYDVCPQCDPCTCSDPESPARHIKALRIAARQISAIPKARFLIDCA